MAEAATLRNRIDAIRWAREMVANPDVVFPDTETTGLGRDAEVVDLAIVDLAGTPIVDQLVRPLRPIPADAIFIHGISNRDVAEAPLWSQIAPDVRNLLHRRTIVAYNAPFDRAMVDQCNTLAGLHAIDASWFCAMRAFTAARNDRTPDELWLCEHPPVYTQGLAGRAEHVRDAGLHRVSARLPGRTAQPRVA